MSTSERTFDHVKSILGKLDRNREAARDRRVAGQGPRPAGSGAPIPATLGTGALGVGTGGIGGESGPARALPPGGYGRATPLRLTERHDH